MAMAQLGRTMLGNVSKRCHALSLLALLILVCASCTTVIESGEFGGLEIGMSKQEVLIALRERTDIIDVRVRVREDVFIEFENLEDIPKLSGSELIIISGPSFSAHASFDDGYIEEIYESMMNKVELPLEVGMSTADFLSAMRGVMENNPRFRMYNAVKDSSRGIELNRASHEDEQYLYSYDSWVFGETDQRSTNRLFFEDVTLAKIVHTRYFFPGL